MREIIFRGKRTDNGEWIEGHYGEYMLMSGESIPCISIPNKEAVCGSISYDVEASTVGQYTGLTDKNGKKIFEGNIVSIYTPCNEKHNIGVIRFGYYASGIPTIFKTNLGFYIEWASEDNINRIDFGFWIQAYQDETEVIGNIHDNPKLLEEEEE